MVDIPYIYDARIIREDDELDEFGNAYTTDVYFGKCDYQVGSSGDSNLYDGTLLVSPKIFIPKINLNLEFGDKVKILIEGRKVLEGEVRASFEKDFEKLFGEKYAGLYQTEVWLENMTEYGA